MRVGTICKKIISSVKVKLVSLKDVLSGLFMEQKGEKWRASIGRVAFWCVLIPAVMIWVKAGGSLKDGMALSDISPNHLTVLLTLAGYNFGTKAVKVASDIFGKDEGPG